MPPKPADYWTAAQVASIKETIKAELDAATGDGGPKARIAHALERIAALEAAATPEEMLRRFVLAVSALVQHERTGGLKDKQLRGLFRLAQAILQVHVPNPMTSRLGFLHGDFHLLRSQIHRREGKHWLAAWDQQMSIQASGRNLSQGEARQRLALGIRALRLGDADLARQELETALAAGLPPALTLRARLGVAQVHRLQGRYDACHQEIATSLAAPQIDDSMRADLTWEAACADAARSGDLRPLIAAVGPRGSHRAASYFLEVFLWVRVAARKEWEQRFPRVRSMARGRALNATKEGVLYDAALALEECYDTEIPLHVRLRGLRDVLARRHLLIGLDKELLLLGASVVWLARAQAFGLASLVLNEYRALSLRIGSQRSGDVLQLLGAYYEKPWYAGAPAPDAAPERESA